MLKPKPELLSEANRSELLGKLPVEIIRVEVQKHDNSRFSLFCHDSFLFGLPVALCESLEIGKGTMLTESLFRQIETEAIRDGLRSWLLNLLARKPYSRTQMIRKAGEYDSGIIRGILDEFEEKGWLNDESFARSLTRDKVNFRQWGPAKIRQQLSKAGVEVSMADQVLQEEIGSEIQKQQIEALVMKRKPHFLREPNALKRKKKIVDYLLRKGYDPGIVFKMADTLLTRLNE